MRVLILSCNTGQGHNSAADSIKEIFEENDISCVVEDALRFLSDRISRTISNSHVCMYRHAPNLFRVGYRYTDCHRNLFAPNSFAYSFLTQGTDELYTFCRLGDFDAIICTHVFSSLMMTDVKRKTYFPIPVYFVATDYTCSPSAEQSDMDGYFVPNTSLIEEFVRYGLPLERMIASGIPIRKMFLDKYEKSAAKRTFSILPEHQHIVMMCGSMGCGPLKKLVSSFAKTISENHELTVICGTNKHLFKSLSQRYSSVKNIHILGYVENIALLLDSADLYLTKPGGISVTEAAAKGLPMVFIDAVAGCEEHNMRFFIQRGAAATTKKPQEIVAICCRLLDDKPALERMGKASQSVGSGNGANTIVQTIKEKCMKEA